MQRFVLAMLMLVGLGATTPSLGHDRWGFSFHSYAPPVAHCDPYYAPALPPAAVYAYPAPWVGYRAYPHHYHYVRPLPPPPPVWGPPRSAFSLWLGF